MALNRIQPVWRVAAVASRPAQLSRSLTTSPARQADTSTVADAEAIKYDSKVQPAEESANMMVAKDEQPPSTVDTYHPRNQPKYNTRVDHGTSLFSPVPRRVMDGSEPGPSLPAAVLSGAPIDLQARVVRIYKPVKPATQSGTWGSHAWRMDWDPLPKGHRWENPLMGWQSTADPMQGTKLQFKSREDAVAFAEKQGYEYYVMEPQERRFVPKAYANNFLHEPGPLKHIKTK